MARTIQLYLKNQYGFWGPLSVRGLRERLSATGYTEDTLVSLDGAKWFSAQKIEGIVRQRRQDPAATTPDPELAETPAQNPDADSFPLAVATVSPTEASAKSASSGSESGGRASMQNVQAASESAAGVECEPMQAPASANATPEGHSQPDPRDPHDPQKKEINKTDKVDKTGKTSKTAKSDMTESRHNVSRERLRDLLTRVQNASKRLPWIFPWSVGGVFFASTALLMGLAWGGFHVLPIALSVDVFVLAALLPCVLVGSAISHLAGNFFLRLLTGINDKERRCLALHLPWRSTPTEWPRYLRKWIYTGDWLVENFGGDLLPYVRAFITGSTPCDLEEELDLWAELMSGTPFGMGGHGLEVGHSVREMACVQRLPSWARDVMPGMTLHDLELQLGKAGREWAVSLIRRASRRKNIFCHVDLGGDLHEVSFEFHHCEMGGGREGLMVIIRPRLDDKSLSFLDDSRSDELAAA